MTTTTTDARLDATAENIRGKLDATRRELHRLADKLWDDPAGLTAAELARVSELLADRGYYETLLAAVRYRGAA